MKNTTTELIRRAACVVKDGRVSNTGRYHTNVAILRDRISLIKVVDACDLH